jgi:hypothetical protein
MKIGPIPIPGYTTVTSKLLSLSVEAVSTVEWKQVPGPGGPQDLAGYYWTFTGDIGVIVTVSNADGSPRTDLVATNFSITLLPLIPTTHTINPISSRPGAYGFAVTPTAPLTDPTAWQNGFYWIFVAVTKLLSSFPLSYKEYGNGLAVTSARVSFEQPSP